MTIRRIAGSGLRVVGGREVRELFLLKKKTVLEIVIKKCPKEKKKTY